MGAYVEMRSAAAPLMSPKSAVSRRQAAGVIGTTTAAGAPVHDTVTVTGTRELSFLKSTTKVAVDAVLPEQPLSDANTNLWTS